MGKKEGKATRRREWARNYHNRGINTTKAGEPLAAWHSTIYYYYSHGASLLSENRRQQQVVYVVCGMFVFKYV